MGPRRMRTIKEPLANLENFFFSYGVCFQALFSRELFEMAGLENLHHLGISVLEPNLSPSE